MTYLLGIDGGGTGCRAALVGPDGHVLGRGQSGPANVASSAEGAIANILAAAGDALGAIGLDPASRDLRAGLGLAGANVAGAEAALTTALPFRRMRITTDATTAALGALGEDDGILAAMGTGSVFVARRGGEMRQVGGWGFSLGDEGSGASMGRALLSATLKMVDGRLPPSPLLQSILLDMGTAAQIVSFSSSASPAQFAALAPRLVAAQEPFAKDLCHDLVEDVAAIISFLQADATLPVVFTGGLGPFYASRLAGRWPVRAARGTALDGAIRLAAEVP